MQVMHGKGLLERDTSQRAHIYSPLIEKKDVEKKMGVMLREVCDLSGVSEDDAWV